MALYTISDLHLPLGINKPMDIFGGKWINYVEIIEKNWKDIICQNDTVVLAGDLSWATYLDESKKDFEFLCALPGRKILLKGNHDYWWTTTKKLNEFLKVNYYSNIEFLQNNSFSAEGYEICGSRGWICPESENFSGEDEKIYNRELVRFELSAKAAYANAKKCQSKEIIAFFHYPPFFDVDRPSGFFDIMGKYDITKCFYGHIHGYVLDKYKAETIGGISCRLTSCDYLDFMPIKVSD